MTDTLDFEVRRWARSGGSRTTVDVERTLGLALRLRLRRARRGRHGHHGQPRYTLLDVQEGGRGAATCAARRVLPICASSALGCPSRCA